MNTTDKIRNALEKAQEKPYTNGMATEKVTIETKYGIIDVIRKCGDLEKPEIFLLFLKPNREIGHIEPNNSEITNILERILGINNTDLNIVPKSRYNHKQEYTCIIPVSLFN